MKTASSTTAQLSVIIKGHAIGPPWASARIVSMGGDIGCMRMIGRTQSGKRPIGVAPGLTNAIENVIASNHVIAVRPLLRTAIAITRAVNPVTTIDGTRMKASAAGQPCEAQPHRQPDCSNQDGADERAHDLR